MRVKLCGMEGSRLDYIQLLGAKGELTWTKQTFSFFPDCHPSFTINAHVEQKNEAITATLATGSTLTFVEESSS